MFTEAGLARPTASDDEVPGKLKGIASKVLIKILFAARMARFDLLRATQRLASRVTKWSQECDVSLHWLVSYIHHSKGMFLQGFVGTLLKTAKCGYSRTRTSPGSMTQRVRPVARRSSWARTRSGTGLTGPNRKVQQSRSLYPATAGSIVACDSFGWVLAVR